MSEYLQKLIDAIQENGKPLDMDKIERAYNLAERAHAGQTRASGEPYITHPVEAAIITAKLPTNTAAGWKAYAGNLSYLDWVAYGGVTG